jgi:methionyl aminopeptidase
VRRSPEELAKMRRAGRVVAEMHERIRAAIRPGVTTRELDAIGREVIDERGARSNFLNYGGGPGAPPFPAVICASPNDVIVHGIPDDRPLEEGDIISIDCGAIIEGYHGDAAFTAPVGQVSEEAARLIKVTDESLFAGIEQMVDGRSLRRRATAWCASTPAMPSAPPCTRARRSRTGAHRARARSCAPATSSPSSPW